MVLINYLFNKCQGDLLLKAVCTSLHGATHVYMDVDAFTYRDCQPLWAMLLSTPVGASLFGEQFQSSVEEAMHRQEQLSQVRCLISVGSKAAEGSPPPRVSQQSQK